MSMYVVGSSGDDGRIYNIEQDDPSLNDCNSASLQELINLPKIEFNNLFLSKYKLEYITKYSQERGVPFRIVTHPRDTNTCYEKAILLGSWDPLNIIKALYFECQSDQHLYVVVVPETGCFMDKTYLTSLLGLPQGVVLAKSKLLPKNMAYGTCSPFITPDDLLENGGKVAQIIFDSETLVSKKNNKFLDDFSFGLDHRFSLQMNYYHCFKMLKAVFGDIVIADKVLTLSFSEKFIRKNGKINIHYDFKTINYRTAKFINSIHGGGDVTIVNDYVDELDIPDVLTSI